MPGCMAAETINGCMVVLSPAGPRWNSIRSRMFHRWAPFWTADVH